MDSGKQEQQPVIIVKKNHKHGGHHGGAWKVAYADFVTAMMAFFLVMWIVGQGEDIKQSVGGYFRDPVGFTNRAGSGVLKGGPSVLEHPKPPSKDERDRRRMEAETQEALAETGEQIMRELQHVPGFSELADRISVELADGGLRIQLMESGDSTFFGLGSAELTPSGLSVVRTVAQSIASLSYDIIVEGHTDSRPYSHTRKYSNWELASDRANSARRVLEEYAIAPARFAEIRSFADKKLRFPDRPEDPRNRRIGIIVLNPFTESDDESAGVSGDGRLADREPPH